MDIGVAIVSMEQSLEGVASRKGHDKVADSCAVCKEIFLLKGKNGVGKTTGTSGT